MLIKVIQQFMTLPPNITLAKETTKGTRETISVTSTKPGGLGGVPPLKFTPLGAFNCHLLKILFPKLLSFGQILKSRFEAGIFC